MKQNLLFLIFLSAATLLGQTVVQETLPLVWYRADSARYGDECWRNTVSGRHPALFSGGDFPLPDTLLNFNPAFRLGGGGSFTVPLLPLGSARVTAIVAYRASGAGAEMGLWEVMNPLENTSAGLSTQRVLGPKGSVRYGSSNEPRTIINTLGQNWRGQNDSSPSAQLNIALHDTLAFEGLLAEFLLFDKGLSPAEVVSWISYLAVKHGVTLFETNYEDGGGSIIWNYEDHANFSHSVAGVGRDDARGLLQKQSLMLQDRVTAGLGEPHADNASNGTPIDDGDFLLWGFDSSGLQFQGTIHGETGEAHSLYGNGLMQRTGANIIQAATFLRVDGGEWGGDPLGYFLLIDRSGAGAFASAACEWIAPDSADSTGMIFYNGIRWDTDANGVDRFCFASAEPTDGPRSTSGNGAESGENGEGVTGKGEKEKGNGEQAGNQYRLYPNPTPGEFRLEIDYAEASEARVAVYNSAGQLVKEMRGGSDATHRFRARLPVGGHYLIEVRGGNETRSFKLVVQ
jgi:hypothetical protein